jgi:hypothetical protein
MNKVVKHLLSFNLLLLFALDWLVWGEFIPQTTSLGYLAFVGAFIVLSIFAFFLEYLPELLRIHRQRSFSYALCDISV